jgi:uncharacterized protein HemX
VLKIIVVFLFALGAGFACGYAVREWISTQRRKQALNLAHQDFTGRKHQAQLSTLEGRIAANTSEIKALRDEARIQLAAIRNLLERKSEVPEPSEKAVAPTPAGGEP